MNEYVFGFLVGAVTMYLALKPQIKEMNKLMSVTIENKNRLNEIEESLRKEVK